MLWIDFANSLTRDPLGPGAVLDQLKQGDWLGKFAKKWHLRPLPAMAASDRKRLCRLRSLLHRWVSAMVTGQAVSKRDIRALNRYLSAGQATPQLNQQEGRFRMNLVPDVTGVDAWLFAVVVSFAEFLVDADPTRLKTCDNPDCLWVFYDGTRSRTRRWCATSCGDLIKVREFRRRQRKAGGGSGSAE
jgi:predicted RNA-binding Zn ribbon-like protein